MEKRFITFIVISFLILVGWQLLLSRFYPEAITTPKDLKTQQTATPNPSASPSTAISTPTPNPTTDPNNPTPPPDAAPVVAAVSPKKITVKTSYWNAVFDNKGAVLTSLNFHHFHKKELKASDHQALELINQTNLTTIGAPFRLEADAANITKILNESFYNIDAENEIELKDGETKELIFTLKDASGITVEKHLKLTGGKWIFDFQIKALNNNQPFPTRLVLGPNFGDQSVKKFDYYSHTPPQILVNQNGKTSFVSGTELEHRGGAPDATKVFNNDIDWVATIDHYFAMAVIPPSKLSVATLQNNFFQDAGSYKHILSLSFPVANDQNYLVFMGPKDRDLLAEISSQTLKNKHDLETMINYGFFAFIVRPTIPVLDLVIKLVHNSTSNYGWAIIAIAFLTNIIFFPLKWKSSIAMEKAKKFQPRQKEIQEKLKTLKPDDPRAIQLQSEMLSIFKESNPFMGCLPVLLSFPILWAMYIYLLMSLDVRQSGFIFWIKDLSIADPTYILPVIMTVASTAATLIMPNPAPMDDPSQKMQKFMFTYIMPVIFLVFFFINAPSGLVLYWMFNSVFGVAVQLIINKLVPKPVTSVAKT